MNYHTFMVETKGHGDCLDLTPTIQSFLKKSNTADAVLTVFVNGSTAAITTIEYETGVIHDFNAMLENIAPEHADYHHHKQWGDKNGAAHIRSALIGASKQFPIKAGKLQTGTWQQIVVFDFDEKPRQRTIILTLQ